jgi:hypothetical protein
MQKLDETHCKSLLFLRSENPAQVSKGRQRTSIVQDDLWIMEVGHDRGGEGRNEARRRSRDLEMVGRTMRRGILRAPILKGA